MDEREKRYQLALKKGHSAAWDLEWGQAAAYYKQALEDKPGDLKALNNLALALFEMQEYSESLQHYLLVAKETPQDPIPFEKIAILYDKINKPDVGSKIAAKAADIYLKSGDIDKAIENWVLATTMNPENINAHTHLAILYERLRYTQRAVRVYLQIASIMQHSGHVDKAVQAINRALKISPNDDEAINALETLREGKSLPYPSQSQKISPITKGDDIGLLSEPQAELNKEQTPIQEAEQKALSELAGLFFELASGEGERRKAKAIDLKQIVSGSGPLVSQDVDNVNLRLHLGQVVEDLSRGERSRAAENLIRLIDIGLNHPVAFYQLGVIHYENDRLESSIQYLRRSVNHKDYALASRMILSQALKKQGHIKNAALENLEALKIADTEFIREDQVDTIQQLYDPLIETYAQRSNDEDSRKLCKAIDDILYDPEWRKNFRKIRDELSNGNEQPIPIAEVLTSVSSSQVILAMGTIRQLAREGRRHAAIEEALFALQEVPHYLPIHITIGDILLASNQVDSAIEKFKVVARTYSVRGESGRAVDMLRRVVNLSPLDLKARQDLINHLTIRGQSEDALEENIRMAEIYFNLADLSQARKTYSNSLRYIEQAGLDSKWKIAVLHKIADIDVQSLKWRQGLKIYEKIRDIKPDDYKASQNIIDLYFRLGERKQAVTVIGKFVETLKKENRLEEIASFLEDLIDNRPKEPLIRTLLADQYEKMNRLDDAVEQYGQAKEILLNMGNTRGVVVMLKKIIALRPENLAEYEQALKEIQ